jgi:glucosylglycerate phosphorylase
VKNALISGGQVSYKHNPDGSHSPYELNINYFDALNGAGGETSLDIQVEKFVTAHAIMLALCGVPGIYFHSLFGSRGWMEGVHLTGQKRSINRQKLNRRELEQELDDKQSVRFRVYSRIASLLKARCSFPEFNPYGEQQIISLNPSVFSVLRYLQGSDRRILCLHNVSNRPQEAIINISPRYFKPFLGIKDIINKQLLVLNKKAAVKLKPYQTKWLLLEK